MVIRFQTEFLTLPDRGGKLLGTDAALFLSQAAWLSENRADEKGWAEWTMEDCEKQTGIKPDTQARICKRLEQAGYLKSDRRGEKGKRFLRCVSAICGNRTEQIPQIAETENSENEVRYRNLRKQNVSDTAICGNRIPQFAETETDLFPIKETKTRGESIPPISPHKAATRKIFVKPTWEELLVYMTEIGIPGKAKRWLSHYEANGWLVGKNPMKDWRAACRTWLEDDGVRGSPTRNGHAPLPPKTSEEKDQEEWEALERIAKRGGIDFGRRPRDRT